MQYRIEGVEVFTPNRSYIVNYRYGFTSLVDKLNLIDADGAHVDFQDFSAKQMFPTKRVGTFSVFGLGFYDNLG